VDPAGVRTLGIITKPDTLDAGSDSENAYLRLTANKDVVLKLGWHVLKNRDYKARHVSSTQRDKAESDFFSEGVWMSINPAHLGVISLKPRLSNILNDQILRHLPGLLQDVELGILDCHARIKQLGAPRATIADQRRYLSQVSYEFSNLMKAAVDGVYNDPFFGSSKTNEGYQKRLRAVVQNMLIEFAEEMRFKGKARIIIESSSGDITPDPRRISRENYIDETKELMRKSRGRELPGTFNPLVVGELFSEQCRPWRGISNVLKDDVVNAVYRTTEDILGHVAAEDTADGISRILNEGIEKLKSSLDVKVAELLEPHHRGHPITYNHYLTANVQETHSGRQKRAIERVLKETFGLVCIASRYSFVNHNVDFSILVDSLVLHAEVDMEQYGSSLAVDYTEAYYKVSDS